MERESSSWKEKVDPAFDKIIKYFIQFIESAGLPANSGWLKLEDEPLKLWEEKGMQGWIKNYEKDMTNEKNTIVRWKIRKMISDNICFDIGFALAGYAKALTKIILT
jgi:hypothetical protein